MVPRSLTARLAIVFLVPTTVLGVFAAAEVSRLRSTAHDAAVMSENVSLLRISERLSVPLAVEHNLAYALRQADNAGVGDRLTELLDAPNLERTIGIARSMVDDALHELDEMYGDLVLQDGTRLSDAITAVSSRLAEARTAVDGRQVVDIEQSYGALYALTARLDEVTDDEMAAAASTPELAAMNAQVQTFEEAMDWGTAGLDHIVDSAISGTANDSLAGEAKASGAFSAALERLRDHLPPDRAAQVDELLALPSFTEASRVESLWIEAISAAGNEFADVAASPAAVASIAQLYEARVQSVLSLYSFGERFLDEQAAIADQLRREEKASEHRAVTWIWVAAGGSVLLLAIVLSSTLLPLRLLDRRTRQLREGDLAVKETRPSGPSDVRSLTTTFNEMVVTLRAFDAQVKRLAQRDTAIDHSLPGPLGDTLRASVGRLAEVTDQLHRSEATAVEQARTDALTGLANRTAVLEHLAEIGASARVSGEPGAIVYLDLDGFKNVNDTQGHGAGDRILRQIGMRLRDACPNDVVARLGGDEFIVLIERAVSIERVEAFARQLIVLVSRPCEARDGQQFMLTASAGVTLVDGECQPLECIAQADSAVYCAKEKGRSRVEAYDERLAAEIETRSEMALLMRRSLDHGGFSLQLQPIVELADNVPVGAEALLRWTLPDGRCINPAEFIPIAERTGVILAIDEWVITQALDVLRTWQAHPATAQFHLAVNISGRHISDGSLPHLLATKCQNAGVDPRFLGIEVTETYLMADAERARVVLEQLRELGVGIAIDDFGTGYSSMSSLHELPADTIKIDQLFVAGLTRSATDRTIVELVLRLADSLGMKVIAEGVDSDDKLAHLRLLGCQMAQGFHLAAPMSVDDCTEWLCQRAITPIAG